MKLLGMLLAVACCGATSADAGILNAGVAKVDITDAEAGPVNDPLFVKALVLKHDGVTVVLVTVDAVAIAEIGSIKNDYLATVRAALKEQLGLDPKSLLINASHCHGKVRADVAERTVAAVREAHGRLVPVTVRSGKGTESRVSENRRLKLASGKEADVRHAYSLPPDDAVVSVGPIDPEIGILRLDRAEGGTLAVVYNFACHPIQGVPSGGNTADMTGFASKVIEESFGNGAIALFVQGCGGDINPVRYKDVSQPRDAETLGNLLGLSTVRTARQLAVDDPPALKLVHESLPLPRADNAERIAALEAEQLRLLKSLRGTSLNLKTYLPLVVQQGLSKDYPSYYSHRYLQDRQLGRHDQENLDAENRRNVEQYTRNIYVMEELTRLQTNLALLHKHQSRNVAAGSRMIDVELVGVRVGDFVLVTFPGELTVQIGLNLKRAATHPRTFVAGYTNGYIYYAPTAEQLKNVGGAQEDSDCLLAPEWQATFESHALELMQQLTK